MSTEDLAARGDVVASAKLRDKVYQQRIKRLLPFVLVLLFLSYSFGTNYIPSGSMKPNLQPGDHILTMRAWIAYPFGMMPARGDIILFRLTPEQVAEADSDSDASSDDISSQNDTGVLAAIRNARKNILIKRVIGLPGDTVLVTTKAVIVNGKPISESYDTIPPTEDNLAGRFGVDSPYKVPPGHFYVLGDNRNNSEDSRYWGTLDRYAIVGKYITTFYHQDVPAATPGSGAAQP